MSQVKLKKSQDTITLLEEITGEIDMELERAFRSSVKVGRSKNGNIEFDKNKKMLMEFAPLMITKIVGKDGQEKEPTLDYIKALGFSDYKQLKAEIEKLTEETTFL